MCGSTSTSYRAPCQRSGADRKEPADFARGASILRRPRLRRFSLLTPQRTEIRNYVIDFFLAEPGAVCRHQGWLVVPDLPEVLLQKGPQVVLLITQLDGNIVFIQPNAGDGLAGFGNHLNGPVSYRHIGFRFEERLLQVLEIAPAADIAQIGSETAAIGAYRMAGLTRSFAFENQLPRVWVARRFFTRSQRAEALHEGNHLPDFVVGGENCRH